MALVTSSGWKRSAERGGQRTGEIAALPAAPDAGTAGGGLPRAVAAAGQRLMAVAIVLGCGHRARAMSASAMQSGTVITTAALCRTAMLMMDAPAMSAASRPRRARPAAG